MIESSSPKTPSPRFTLVARTTRFGGPDVVELTTRPLPELRNNEILVRVHNSTVSTADIRLRSKNVPRGFGLIMGFIFGFKSPRFEALGTDLSGEVIEVGKEVRVFRVGDRVIANLGMQLGGHSQFKILADKSVVAKIPPGVSFEAAAAAIFGGTTALAFLRDKLKIKKGERLLVIGAAGAVGSAAVQLGKMMGAEVVGVCSASKTATVANLGAHRTIPYDQADWLQEPHLYDAILDTVGVVNLMGFKSKLKPSGRIGLVVADLPMMLRSVWESLTTGKKVFAGPVNESPRDLESLMIFCKEGTFRPLIGAVLPFEKIHEAHKIAGGGHKLGSVVLKF